MQTEQLRLKGRAYVTLIDARAAKVTPIGGNLRILGLTVHLASAGDRINLDSLALTPADWKEPTVGDEYVRQASPGGGGNGGSGTISTRRHR